MGQDDDDVDLWIENPRVVLDGGQGVHREHVHAVVSFIDGRDGAEVAHADDADLQAV